MKKYLTDQALKNQLNTKEALKRHKQNEWAKEYYHRQKFKKLEQANAIAEKKLKELKGEI
jgi:hypothetical protein